ncbi:MAG: helix-turn-helix transcriptional regulator [Bacteroidales bacterium]|nr:helix-turn-helix transcriptional regulator [Bacteroidales bacterium]
MKNRISKILREEGMTATKFAEEIGVQASSISHIISGRNNPSTDFIIKLLERFRGINAEWLLTGKGEMYKSSDSGIKTDENSIYTGKDTLFSNPSSVLEDRGTINASLGTDTIIDKDIESLEKPVSDDESSLQTSFQPTSSSEKTVEKIVVFFTDKTFESYNPHK